MTNGNGFIPTLDVKPNSPIIQCGINGAIIGVQIDKLENPTKTLWPDPHLVGKHCEVDISARVAALSNGEYHLATTIVDDGTEPGYIYHDPHISVYFIKSSNPMNIIIAPKHIKLTGG